MSNSMTFHSQIASVMEVLANAAVAEICKLVDDDYAVFRLEMTQSQRENRVLRRKLQTLELKMARDRAERTVMMRERVLAPRLGSTAGVKTPDRFRGSAARGDGHLPGRHRSFGKAGEVEERQQDVWRPDDRPVAANEGPDSSTQDVLTVTILDECAEGNPCGSVASQVKQERSPPPPSAPPGLDRQSKDPEDAESDVCLVKEERKEAEEGVASPDLDTVLITGGECLASGAAAAAAGDWTMETSPRTWARVPQEPLVLHQEPGPGPGPGSEPDQQGAAFSLPEHGHWTGGPSLNNLGPISLVPHIWTQRRPPADSGSGSGVNSGSGVGSGSGAGVSSGPGARPDLGPGARPDLGPGARPDLGPGARPDLGPGARPDLGPGARPDLGPGARPDLGPGARPDLGPAPRPNLNHLPPHSYLPTMHGIRTTHLQHQRSHAYNTLCYPNALSAGSKTYPSPGAAAAVAAAPPLGAPRPPQPGRADGRGRADSERPYSCPTCGKRFTEASYVKKHQTVHTKEKPFRCKQCWKSFSFLSNLIRHRGVHRVNMGQQGAVDWAT